MNSRIKGSLYLVCLFLIACKGEQNLSIKADNLVSKNGIQLPVLDFESFKPLLHAKDDKIRVINFWATWCKPCVAELPFFELVNSTYKDRNVEVILVSLDVPSHIETKLIPFLTKQHIESEVVVLDDPDANSWIPKVNKNWSGSIPATLVYRNNQRRFYEKSFTYSELEKEIKSFL